MIKINNTEIEYLIDLNESTRTEYLLRVDSSFNNKKTKWQIVSVSDNKSLSAHLYKNDYIKIMISILELKKEEIITIKNKRDETYKIRIIPNAELISEKKYVFRIDKYDIDDDYIAFNVFSKENRKNKKWYVSYDGKPLLFDIKTTKTRLFVKPLSNSLIKYQTCIELTQEDSGNIINILLTQNCMAIDDIKITLRANR